jgi:mRNA-degrading endonuclease toxin of MazEF toxin-antitoxin module
VNDFIVRALTAYVHAMERKAVDDAFLPMREDADYRREALKIAEEFTASDA